MMQWINKLLLSWQEEVKVRNVSALFQKSMYLLLFLHFLRLLFIGEHVWGENSFVILAEGVHGFDQLAFLLNDSEWREYYVEFLLLELLLLLSGMFGLQNVITRFLVFFICVLLHNGNYEINNGGYNLIQQILFFHIGWISISKTAFSKTKLASLRNLIHNLTFYAIWVQIALLYLSAGVLKLSGELWLNGTALSHVLSIEEYSLPWIITYAESNPFMLKIATWITLFYQLTIPIAIFISRLRPYWLFVGIGVHLGIAFIAGITDFGLIMVFSFMIFIPEERAAKILPYFKFKNRLVVK